MEKDSKEYIENLANITGCIVGAITAADQISDSRKEAIVSKGQEAMNILHEFGYSFTKKEVDYKKPTLPTYIVTEIATKKVIFKMTEIHSPAKKWYDYFTNY
ncbi:hypothetical protein [Pantoea agglomerans]|uniref:hypothetical protein n=1 Tax=Enterobacter agglomerans TaxID=549 RepID=UPI003C7E85CD